MHRFYASSSYWVVLTLLRCLHAQDVQYTLMFQGTGFAGSVVAATGCDITYELECTAGASVCIPTDVVKTVTLNGPSLYTMAYYSTGSTSAGLLTQTLDDTCTLLGTTAANCHATAAVAVSDISLTTTSIIVITDAAALGYAQIPITAGPATALRSVSSCSANSGVETSSPASTTTSQPTSVSTAMSGTGEASAVAYPSSGLSTGAKVGIGVGVGVAGAALLAVGAWILLRRRKRRDSPPLNQPPMASAADSDHSQVYRGQQGPYEFEQPAIKHEMPVGKQAHELPGQYGSYELPTSQR